MSTTEQDLSLRQSVAIASIAVVIFMTILYNWGMDKKGRINSGLLSPDTQIHILAIDDFLNNIERENPVRFTSQQLKTATDNYSNMLRSGGFGAVYKGTSSNGTIVAVKVLYGSSDKRIKEQFMAEVSKIGRTNHFNLVRLYIFCFESDLRVLVYEYMGNGSLDKYLFHEN